MTQNRLKDGEIVNYYHKKITTQTITKSKNLLFLIKDCITNNFIAIEVISKAKIDLEALKKVNEGDKPKVI